MPVLLAIVAVLSFASDMDGRRLETIQVDLSRLQGKWSLARFHVDGRVKSFEPGTQVTIAGRKLTWGSFFQSASIVIESTPRPSRIDIRGADGVVWRGIYSLENKRLTICISTSGNRPTVLENGAGVWLMVFNLVEHRDGP